MTSKIAEVLPLSSEWPLLNTAIRKPRPLCHEGQSAKSQGPAQWFTACDSPVSTNCGTVTGIQRTESIWHAFHKATKEGSSVNIRLAGFPFLDHSRLDWTPGSRSQPPTKPRARGEGASGPAQAGSGSLIGTIVETYRQNRDVVTSSRPLPRPAAKTIGSLMADSPIFAPEEIRVLSRLRVGMVGRNQSLTDGS